MRSIFKMYIHVEESLKIRPTLLQIISFFLSFFLSLFLSFCLCLSVCLSLSRRPTNRALRMCLKSESFSLEFRSMASISSG